MNCPVCSAVIPDSLRHCSSCQTDAGFPNVRECSNPMEVDEVNNRLTKTRARAAQRGCEALIDELNAVLRDESVVCVTMPAQVARSLAEDPRLIYSNYESQVGAGFRIPAQLQNDRHRAAIGGLLFGSYATKIRYGLMTIGQQGLPSYGGIVCRLRSKAIEHRTSFLDENSYTFVRTHELMAGDPIPMGHRAIWSNRGDLALAKVGDGIHAGFTRDRLQDLIVKASSKTRSEDEFIEAHIYDGFDVNAIEEMSAGASGEPSPEVKLDIKIALAAFATIRSKRTAE